MGYQATSLGISVLALLRQRPMHGYEMLQTLSARHVDRIIKVRPGSLYHVLYRLAEEKLIRHTGTGRHGNRPERTTYELTDSGADALRERVTDLVANPVNEFEKFVVALAEIHHLDRDVAVQSLRRRISVLDNSAAEMRALLDLGTTAPMHRAALDYLLATTTAEVAWLRDFVESLHGGRAVRHEVAT